MSDLSIIIQGPLNGTSLNNIGNYIKFGQVIISTWQYSVPQHQNKLDEIKSLYSDDVDIIINPLGVNVDENDNILPLDWFNNRHQRYNPAFLINELGEKQLDSQNMAKQVNSTLYGLQQTNTKFVLKTRSDECFEDLEWLTPVLLDNINKFVSGDIFITGAGYLGGRTDISHIFHISDHFFCGTTELILNTINISRQRQIENKIIYDRGLHGRYDFDINNKQYYICPETLIGSSAVMAMGHKIDINKARSMMNELFHITHISQCRKYIITSFICNHSTKEWASL